MNKNRILINQFLFLFTLLVAMLCISGCSKKNVNEEAASGPNPMDVERELINKNIPDPIKRANLLAVLDKADSSLQVFTREKHQHQQHIRDLAKNYKTTKEDVENALSEFNDKYDAIMESLIESRMALKSLTSEEEWQKISQRDETILTE